MTSHVETVCRSVFQICYKSNEKNRSCAKLLARERLIASGMSSAEVALLMPSISELLDQWFDRREADISFIPPVIETGRLSDTIES